MKLKTGNHNRVCSFTGSLLAAAIMSSFFITGCGPILDPEIPVFRFELDLPVNDISTAAELILNPGKKEIVSVDIVSTRDEPVEISLDISREKDFPDDILIIVPESTVSLHVGETVTVDIVFDVGNTVPPGLYHTHLVGTLGEPIKGWGGTARAIDIIITDESQDTNISVSME
ncbi:MAG: hypothetical protein PVG61_00665 [Dehalococcoidia bacterium]|jgi:hypothetical protein